MQEAETPELWLIKANITRKRAEEKRLKKEIDELLKQMKLFQCNRLVARFNAKYPVGSKVSWRHSPIDEYQEYTVKRPAFLSNGQPVVYFIETSGFCSIDPIFIQKKQRK